VPQDESSEKATSLAEKGALEGTQEKKEGLTPVEARADDSRAVQGLSLDSAERKLER